MRALERRALRDLVVTDEAAFRHVGLYAELRAVVAASGPVFLVPRGGVLSWDHASLLNLAFWKGDADVLAAPELPADALLHTAWHLAGARALGPASRSPAGMLLCESVASAFDLYLVGRLLGRTPEAQMLESQVPRMTEVALDAGASEGDVEALFARAAAEPERAFAELRRVLFDVSLGLLGAPGPVEAHAVLERARGAGGASVLLHHFELPTWILYARAYGEGADDDALAVDRGLREGAPDGAAELDLLGAAWLPPSG